MDIMRSSSDRALPSIGNCDSRAGGKSRECRESPIAYGPADNIWEPAHPPQAIISKSPYAIVIVSGNTAIKTMTDLEAGLREMMLMSVLEHPNVVKLIGVTFALRQNTPTISLQMRRYHCDLHMYALKRDLSAREIVIVVRDLLAALAFIHSRGIIHCDVKPKNILLKFDCWAETPTGAVLCDFGLSVLTSERLHKSSVQTGQYRAPEINYNKSRIQFTPAIDMWSVGCVIYRICAGESFIVEEMENSDDSSLFICHRLGLVPSVDGHKLITRNRRMSLLNNVSHDYLTKKLWSRANQRGIHRSVLWLMILCFYPSWRLRVTSQAAVAMINRTCESMKLARIPVQPMQGLFYGVSSVSSVSSITSLRCGSDHIAAADRRSSLDPHHGDEIAGCGATTVVPTVDSLDPDITLMQQIIANIREQVRSRNAADVSKSWKLRSAELIPEVETAIQVLALSLLSGTHADLSLSSVECASAIDIACNLKWSS
jgi:serine/threonine protein kinase